MNLILYCTVSYIAACVDVSRNGIIRDRSHHFLRYFYGTHCELENALLLYFSMLIIQINYDQQKHNIFWFIYVISAKQKMYSDA